MKDASVMDITLHDSGSQFKEDLAMIRGNTQTYSTARRQNNIIVNNSDNDSDADTSVLDRGTGSDKDTEDTEEEFGEMVNFDDSDNSGSDIMQAEQNSQISSESELDRKSDKHVLKRNTKKLNNNVLNSDESDVTIEHFISKESVLKRKRNETDTCLVTNTENSKLSKQLLVHKRTFQKCKLTDREKCELEENHDWDDESKNVKLMKNLKMKTKKQKHESAIIRCKDDEEIACNVDGGDGDVDSVCEKDAGDIAEEESGEVEDCWEDIYGRTRDKQGNVIQVRIHS
jgi:hypothetical protein